MSGDAVMSGSAVISGDAVMTGVAGATGGAGITDTAMVILYDQSGPAYGLSIFRLSEHSV